jgi:excisionase family DNA binding protein
MDSTLSSNATGDHPPAQYTQLLTAEQLAERWQVAPTHVYRLARDGYIPVVRLGKYYRFRLDQIERWELDADAAAS